MRRPRHSAFLIEIGTFGLTDGSKTYDVAGIECIVEKQKVASDATPNGAAKWNSLRFKDPGIFALTGCMVEALDNNVSKFVGHETAKASAKMKPNHFVYDPRSNRKRI